MMSKPCLHELNIEREPYEAVCDGMKTFEFRKDDRGFSAGDTLRLRLVIADPSGEWFNPPNEFVDVLVTYIARGRWGIPDGYCIMAICLTGPEA